MVDNANRHYENVARTIEGARFEIVDFWRFNEKSDIWNFIPHAHNYFELIFFLHGNAQISLENRSLYATFSDALLYPPRALHTEHLQINHRQEIYCLQVRCADIKISEVLHIQDRHQQIKLILDGLFTEYNSPACDAHVVDTWMRALATVMARNYFFPNAPAHPVETCMMYMRHNLTGEIGIRQLADLIHVSRSYLNQLFVRHTGVTPMQYLQDIRIDAAKSLLMTTDRRISDIAEDVGFHSPKYFCATFHRRTGMSPREYRNSEGLRRFSEGETPDARAGCTGDYGESMLVR